MRKALSTLLLLILAFNWLGYEFVVGLLMEHNRLATQRDIDRGRYNARQLIEIKVDLHLPYATDWPAFEAVEGIVTYQGAVYNFVERKYEGGHMIYRCLPNSRGTELQNAREYFQSLAFDLDTQEGKDNAPKQTPSPKKLILETTILERSESQDLMADAPAEALSQPPNAIRAGFGFTPSEPPEA